MNKVIKKNTVLPLYWTYQPSNNSIAPPKLGDSWIKLILLLLFNSPIINNQYSSSDINQLTVGPVSNINKFENLINCSQNALPEKMQFLLYMFLEGPPSPLPHFSYISIAVSRERQYISSYTSKQRSVHSFKDGQFNAVETNFNSAPMLSEVTSLRLPSTQYADKCVFLFIIFDVLRHTSNKIPPLGRIFHINCVLDKYTLLSIQYSDYLFSKCPHLQSKSPLWVNWLVVGANAPYHPNEKNWIFQL